ncbi:MAG: efflux RND transporter periplasmic adaptor subunit [Isosphaeraceae bacterium]
MNATWRKLVVLSVTATSAILATVAGCAPPNAYVPPPPPEVTVSTPVRRSVMTYVPYTGTTRASEQVELRARVKGFLKERRFREGDDVKAGDVLFVIDEEPFKVRVAAAEAQLEAANAELQKAKDSKTREVSAAQVAVDQALLALAQIEERRNRQLLVRNAASREDVDRTEAARKKSEAQVEADKASLEQARTDFAINIAAAKAKVDSARADLENARIDLGYCKITSPIDGRISRRTVDVGNLVGDAQATVLALIVKDDPIYAYVSVSDADVLMFRSLVREGRRVDYRKEKIPIELGLSTETGYPHVGRLDYSDPGADPGTGTVQARGVFSNPDHVIIPGLFVRVRVPLENQPNALLLPERALGADQAGRHVMVVGSDNIVKQRPVTVGDVTDDGLRIILTGINAEDRVIIDGLQYARPDQPVTPKPATPEELTPARSPGEAPKVVPPSEPAKPAETPATKR